MYYEYATVQYMFYALLSSSLSVEPNPFVPDFIPFLLNTFLFVFSLNCCLVMANLRENCMVVGKPVDSH